AGKRRLFVADQAAVSDVRGEELPAALMADKAHGLGVVLHHLRAAPARHQVMVATALGDRLLLPDASIGHLRAAKDLREHGAPSCGWERTERRACREGAGAGGAMASRAVQRRRMT